MLVEDKAAEFGRGVNAPSGRRLWWLAWTSTFAGRQRGRPKNDSQESFSGEELVSQREFARLASCSQTQVSRVLSAGRLMQEDGLLPRDDEKENFSDWDELASAGYMVLDDECEDPTQHWSHYYRMAKHGRPEPEPEPESTPKRRKRSVPISSSADEFHWSPKDEESQDDSPAEREEPSNDERVISRTSRKEILGIMSRAAHSVRKMIEGIDLADCDEDERDLADAISEDLTESACAFNKLRSEVHVE